MSTNDLTPASISSRARSSAERVPWPTVNSTVAWLTQAPIDLPSDGYSPRVIREARPHDAEDLLRLVQQLAIYEREPDAVRTTPEDLAAALDADEPRVRAHVAEVDGAIVGMALWFLTYSTWTGTPTLYLEDLFVDPEHRADGLGKALMKALAAEAKKRGCARMEWSVLDWNESAIAFYRSFGAEPMEEWTTWRMDL